jgi:hypothetical protein
LIAASISFCSLKNFDVRPSASNPRDGVSEVVLSLSHQRGKKNHKTKKNPTKCPKFKCNTILVSFSACRCSSIVVSSKAGRKKRVWRQVCEWLSDTVAHLPTAVSLLLLEVLFMQIFGVSLALTWPHRLCLLRVLLVTTATSFPLSKHTGGGDTAPTFSGQCVYLQFMWEVGLPPSPVEFSYHHFYRFSHSWLLGVCCLSCLLQSAGEGFPLFPLVLRAPLCYVPFFVVIAYYSVSLFFPGWGSVCPGGLC